MTDGQVTGDVIGHIVAEGKELLHFPTTPLDGVVETLRVLREEQKENGYKMVVFTKGELQDQQNKLIRSGLQPYFDDVVIVSDKTEEEYRRLCRLFEVNPNEMVMIGNSLKSDIAPALAIGAHAIHIPFHVVWQMEHFEPIEHDRMITISSMKELLG